MTPTRKPHVRSLVPTLVALLLIAFAWAPAAAYQATPSTDADSIAITGAVKAPVRMSVADLKQYPAENVTVTYTAGGESEDHSFVGTSLLGVIEDLGLDVPDDAKNPLLPMYIVVTANDGYQVVLSGGELEPTFGNQPVYLAWEQDGQPLTGEQGPIRLVVDGDTKGGRYVHGVVSIEIFLVATAD